MNNNSEILVVGATGYLGKELISYARRKSYFVFGTSSYGGKGLLCLNLDSPLNFNYEIVGCDTTVLLTAAISSPDFCVREHDRAWTVNVTGTTVFIERVLAKGAKVIFFSTDTVYGERSESFNEDTYCSPLGEYAVMKEEIETRFSTDANFKSIRLSYVFSSEDKFSKYLVDSVSHSVEAELFHPFFRSIIYREDVVDGVFALVEKWEETSENVVNFGGPQLLSRIDFAECLKHSVLPELKYKITEPSNDFFRNRPRVIAMRSEVLHRLLGHSSRIMHEVVRQEFLVGAGVNKI